MACTPAMAIAQSSEAAHAEQEIWSDSAAEIELDELEVSASISSLESAKASRIVNVITREEIAALPATSISDILKLTSSVDVRQRSGFGVQADISIDGGTYDQVSILLNGVNITSPQTGHYSADWPVTIDDIERIEIIEGAASRYMGGSSLIGAINIVTRTHAASQATVQIEGGSYGTIGAKGSAALVAKSTRHQLSGAYMRSDGGTVNSEFSRGQAFYQGQISTSAIDIMPQAGFSMLSHGANTFYSGAYPDQHDAINRYIVSVAGKTHGRIDIQPMAYWQRLVDHYQLVRNTSKGETFHRGDTYGGRINASTNWQAGRTTIGAEVRRETILSTTLGMPLDPADYVSANDSVQYTHRDARTSWSFMAEHLIKIGRVNVSAGLIGAINTGLDSKMRLYPGVDIAYNPSRHWRIFASWEEAYRMPTFTDLYYKAPTHEGNRDLQPERMESAQLGAQYSNAWIAVRGNVFFHHGKNMIDWVMYSPDDVFHATGFDLDNLGVSLQGQVLLEQIFGKHQPFTTFDFNYTYMHQWRRDKIEIYESRSALEYLKHKFSMVLCHKLWPGAAASWTLRYADRMGDYLLYVQGQSQGRLQPYKPYAVLDLKIDYTVGSWQFYVSASNLTNHTYYDCANIPQPGLWVMCGAKASLKF